LKEDLANGLASDIPVGPAPQIKLIEASPAPMPAVVEPPPPVEKPTAPAELPPVEAADTSPQDFYKWLTDSNEGNMAHAENVLFRGNEQPVPQQ
jgi:hypothetical protein